MQNFRDMIVDALKDVADMRGTEPIAVRHKLAAYQRRGAPAPATQV